MRLLCWSQYKTAVFNVRGGGHRRTTWQAEVCLVHFSLAESDKEGFVSHVKEAFK